jgi:siroheme synthase
MAMAVRRPIAEHLLEHGWPAATPAAVVASAWTLEERVWSGELGTLAREPPAAPTDDELHAGGPAVLVIGAVAALRQSVGRPAEAHATSPPLTFLTRW